MESIMLIMILPASVMLEKEVFHLDRPPIGRHQTPRVLTHILSHLPPSSLANVSLVSKRFHQLVTTPHAWRSAFSRFFPGSDSLNSLDSGSEHTAGSDALASEKRVFTRLTPTATWRSEYILRTRLLRSLGRGKPAEGTTSRGPGSSSSAGSNNLNAQVTYSSNLVCPVNHLHGVFDLGLNKNYPRFIHGADELGIASRSEAFTTKVDSWGFQDNSAFRQFSDIFPGDAEFGLGPGDVVGNPNVMDVSQPYGMIYGEGHGHESVLWFRHADEKRGRPLLWSTSLRQPEKGIPQLATHHDAYCSVWIANSPNVPDVSEGLVGMLAGSSTGVLTAYSLGTNAARDVRFERGEITARWILSPGVPIVGIAVDEQYSTKRMSSRKVWAVALNALGEAFYLTELPLQPYDCHLSIANRASSRAQQALEGLAWATGRSVQWNMVESTRRTAKIDPYARSDADGSYSPRSSSNETCLSLEQIVAETSEIEGFLQRKPKDFRKACYGWDMRRRLEVDFASSEQHDAGESIVTICCGLDEDMPAQIKRYTRCKVKDAPAKPLGLRASTASTVVIDQNLQSESIFGSCERPSETQRTKEETFFEEWRASELSFGGLRTPQITATTIDSSAHARITTLEDPLLSDSSPSAKSFERDHTAYSAATDVPGCRARMMAIGTKTGTVLVYNLRDVVASNTVVENTLKPVRIIYTDSPQVSCLALSALYLVHGGNDGLVQAWDPLASSTDPIRTLNSRFSSRARRRLIQAEASSAGVGLNLFAASAVCLDPDPTILRGMVSLGSHLRYWSYKSDSTDQYKGNKRRARRSERGSNHGPDRFSGVGRGALKDYIANEKLELEHEKRSKIKEEEKLSGRFGVDLLGPGASEDEIMAYATMLSEEAAQADEVRRKSTSESSEAVSEPEPPSAHPLHNNEDIAQAIRLSLQDPMAMSSAGSSDVSVKYSKLRPVTSRPTVKPSSSDAEIDDDLQYALQLSLAEKESKSQTGKGKDRES
ncbi:uncharacterized protein KY384_007802 [Bacidia gigantensis]|uniref:uncharacterized protein n=1 Tax=Bacidia gigantensis TaxID=2732470 RepID=UPI001D04EC8D|nr:uncharacterized protein KY384_007802 [Bacidia gigantensis]KAG8527649.1 hypothetical protein KY384_007802 [Bacidia gigantensis]